MAYSSVLSLQKNIPYQFMLVAGLSWFKIVFDGFIPANQQEKLVVLDSLSLSLLVSFKLLLVWMV